MHARFLYSLCICIYVSMYTSRTIAKKKTKAPKSDAKKGTIRNDLCSLQIRMGMKISVNAYMAFSEDASLRRNDVLLQCIPCVCMHTCVYVCMYVCRVA